MRLVELYGFKVLSVVFTARMADDGSPITSEHLKQVLDRLDDVLAEAARLRKEVVRQLTEQRAGQQQHVTARKRKRAPHKR
jgi:hypothetical protein